MRPDRIEQIGFTGTHGDLIAAKDLHGNLQAHLHISMSG